MWHHNVDLLAYHDLDGRSGFKLALQEAGGRFFLYVAGFWHSGWSILEVTDPEHPELLRWLDGPPNTMTIQVQVAGGTMITALEHPPPGLTIGDPAAKPEDGFLIWDVCEPDRPQLLGQWVSGGTGTHRNFYNGGPWVYATSSLPGFEGQVLAIVDIADPASPKTAGTWWHPGQHKAADETYTPEDQRRLTAGRPYPQHGLSLHGGAYALGDRAYCPWMRRHGHPRHHRQAPPRARRHPAGLPAARLHHRRALGGPAARPRHRGHQQRGAAGRLRRTCRLRGHGRHLRRDRPDPDGRVPGRRPATARRAFAPRAAGPGRTTSTSSKAWTAWRPTTGWCTSPTSTPACRSTTSATPATRTSPGTTSPTTPHSAAGPYRPSSSTRPKTSWSTAAA
jgi:hypothetical protein